MNVPPVNAAGRPMGIVAPQPETMASSSISRDQRIEVRPGEPVFLFVVTPIGGHSSIEKINKRSAFTFTPCERPAGAAQPRAPGQWLRIELKPNTRAGAVDEVELQSVGMGLPGREPGKEVVPFTLVAGERRFY